MVTFFAIIYYIACFAIVGYILAPLIITIILSFNPAPYLSLSFSGFSLQWYQTYVSSTSWVNATLLSIAIASIVAGLATLLGTSVAFGIVRGRFVGKNIISSLFLLPLVMPPVVLAIGVYNVFSGWHLLGTICGLVLAHTVLALPFVILMVSASLYQFDRALEEAAASLGATELDTLCKVTLPIIRPGILSAALFAFIVSFDELIIALFISNINTITLPQKIWAGLRFEINPIIAAVSTLQIAVIAVILATAFIIRRKRRVNA